VAGLLPPSSPARVEGLLELGVRVSLVHHPRRWDGPATVYVSHLNEASLVVWRQLFTGGAVFETLPGEHNSLLRPPFVTQIAERVAAATQPAAAR
jgi:thioesterase domain-containing protein